MASIPGSHYDIFAPNQPVNMALTYDANSAAPPVSGEFNLEVVINSTGTGDYPIAQGYQGVLIETPPGKGSPATLTMLHGNYGLVDGAGNDRIFLGDGSESIGGALGDTLARRRIVARAGRVDDDFEIELAGNWRCKGAMDR